MIELNNFRFLLLGGCLKRPVYVLGRRTCKAEYQQFLKEVARNFKDGVKRPILYYDGHAAHTSRESVTFAKRYFAPL